MAHAPALQPEPALDTAGPAEALVTHLLTDRRDYAKVRSPALAIYAETFFDVRNGDSAQVAKNLAWEQKYMAPFRAASIERVRRELPNVEIVNVPGTHADFLFTSRELVVAAATVPARVGASKMSRVGAGPRVWRARRLDTERGRAGRSAFAAGSSCGKQSGKALSNHKRHGRLAPRRG